MQFLCSPAAVRRRRCAPAGLTSVDPVARAALHGGCGQDAGSGRRSQSALAATCGQSCPTPLGPGSAPAPRWPARRRAPAPTAPPTGWLLADSARWPTDPASGSGQCGPPIRDRGGGTPTQRQGDRARAQAIARRLRDRWGPSGSLEGASAQDTPRQCQPRRTTHQIFVM